MKTFFKYLNKLANLINIKSKSIINKTHAIFILLTPTNQVIIQNVENEYIILVKQLNPDKYPSPLIEDKDRIIPSIENNNNTQRPNVLTLKCKTTYKMLNNNTNDDKD